MRGGGIESKISTIDLTDDVTTPTTQENQSVSSIEKI